MLLPITYGLEPASALIMLAGIYYGAQYGGSTSAILVNIPGEASAVVTTLDGHQMARSGRAGAALGIAAIASFIAGTVTTVFVAAIGGPLTRLGQLFGAAEYFSLMLVGLVFAVVLARGNILKAVNDCVGAAAFDCRYRCEHRAERLNVGIRHWWTVFDFAVLAMGFVGIANCCAASKNPRHATW